MSSQCHQSGLLFPSIHLILTPITIKEEIIMDVMTALSIYEMDERHPQLEEAIQRLLNCDAMKYIKEELQEELNSLQKDNKTLFFHPQSANTRFNSASL